MIKCAVHFYKKLVKKTVCKERDCIRGKTMKLE